MKKFLGTMSLAFLALFAGGQTVKIPVSGSVADDLSKNAVTGAVVSCNGLQVITDDQGHFHLGKLNQGVYPISINSLGYKPYSGTITVSATPLHLSIMLQPSSFFLEPLEIRSVRASDLTPFAKTNLGKEQIAKENLAQDIPFLLNQTPSVTINSDAGNGVGYTAIRIRGSDATRINVTLNGIPYNDAESMGTYFVDLPDFASSLSSIQVQRGVGTSSNGTGAFGATINLATNEYHEKSYGELNNSFGSFHTWKNTLKFGTGLLGNHFTIDARLSNITSNGFIDRAATDLKSWYVSTAYLAGNSSLRLNIFSGKEKTYQAWYGVPDYLLATDRTYNPAGTEKPGDPYSNQTDNYTQTHYQLFFNHSFTQRWIFNTAVFLTRGIGYYEEYKAGQAFADYGLPDVTTGGTTVTSADLVRRRWLDNYFYGQIASLQYHDVKNELTFGAGWTKYDGKHYGTIPWIQTGTVPSGYRYYDYPAVKSDTHGYVKWLHHLTTQWSSFVDLQYRHVRHDMNGFEGSPSLHITRSFDFLNPKAGITYAHQGWKVYLSYALAHKEPNRDDFQASLISQPKAETLHDIETGIEKRTSRFHAGVNLYYMRYMNQLVLTGQINDVGSYTRINTPDSYRAGIELQAGVVAAKWINLSGNITFSRNKISAFTEYVDDYDTGGQDAVARKKTDISFSPSVIAGGTITLLPVQNLEIDLLGKYVDKQYMDNSQLQSRELKAYYVQDARIGFTIRNTLFREWHITGQINNVFNKKYEPNGYTYTYISNHASTTENSYYPMAGTNYMLAVNITLW